MTTATMTSPATFAPHAAPAFKFSRPMLAALDQADVDEARNLLRDGAAGRWTGDDERALTPVERRLEHEQHAYILLDLWELEDAFTAVLDARDDRASDGDSDDFFYGDITNLSHYVYTFIGVIENETPCAINKHIRMARERRHKGFTSGKVCHGCPVLRMMHALAVLENCLQAVLKWAPTEWVEFLHSECRPLLWLLAYAKAGIESSAGMRMKPAARKMYIAELQLASGL